jgi:sulfur carrier protein ThiS adenylyltransferase
MDQQEYFSRHDPAILVRLQGATIGIAGAGGLGSNVALNLARAGIGRLIVVDFDRIEASNLNRQQYFERQIGMFKATALAQNLKAIHPFTRVDARVDRIDPGNLARHFHEVEILVEAFDLADQKQMLIESWLSLYPGRPLVAVSGIGGWGRNEKLVTRRHGNLFLVGDETAELSPGISPMAPRVAIAAGMQANLVLELLLGE